MAATYSRTDIEGMLRRGRNWGRWGADDELGTLNLVTAEKRIAATQLVRTGRTVSLSRPFPTKPAPNNPHPAEHFMRRDAFGDAVDAAGCVDFLGIAYHGLASTHIDALCHVWDQNGMWNGRRADDVVDSYGSKWASIDKWHEGIITRGVLLDVPGFRDERYVTLESPVHGDELEEVCKTQGSMLEPGDAVVVYSGREEWDKEHVVWGGEKDDEGVRVCPGLHASCLSFLREHDCAVLAWDMMDSSPNEFGLRFTVHAAIPAYGLALVDNCDLGPLVDACREEKRYEFLFIVAPLVVLGATGSPANPLAVF